MREREATLRGSLFTQQTKEKEQVAKHNVLLLHFKRRGLRGRDTDFFDSKVCL